MENKVMKWLILAAILVGLFIYMRYDWTKGAGVRNDDDLQSYFTQKWAEQTRKEAQERLQAPSAQTPNENKSSGTK